MKTITKCILATFIFFSIILAEEKENQKPQWKGKIEYENGVKVIKNPKEPLYKENILNLEEEFTIDTEREECAEIKNNRLYCLREKEIGYKELVVYKMRWE